MIAIVGGEKSKLGTVSEAVQIGHTIMQFRTRESSGEYGAWRSDIIVEKDGVIRVIKAGSNPYKNSEGTDVLENRYGPAPVINSEIGGRPQDIPDPETSIQGVRDLVVNSFRTGTAIVLDRERGAPDPRIVQNVPKAEQ